MMIARGTTIAPSGFCNPDVECEIALRLHKTSDGAVYTRGSVADLIDAVFPAIEIKENSHGDVTARGTPKLSADDFSHKACVLGPAQPDSMVPDWPHDGAIKTCTGREGVASVSVFFASIESSRAYPCFMRCFLR